MQGIILFFKLYVDYYLSLSSFVKYLLCISLNFAFIIGKKAKSYFMLRGIFADEF